MSSQLVDREQVDQMINKALERLTAKLNLEEVNKKSMTLKLKANRASRDPSSGFWESGEEKEQNPFKTEVDSLKLEMTKEIRDMKTDLTGGLVGMQQSIQEMNSFLKQNL